jgi:hypothetical protein
MDFGFAALAIDVFAAFPELIRIAHYGNYWGRPFLNFRVHAISMALARKKKRALPFPGRPVVELEPTTPERFGVIGKLRA